MTGASRNRIIVVVLGLLVGCTYREIPKASFDCTTTTLTVTLVSKVDPTSCLAIDGSITISAEGGLTPYSFNINNGPYQSEGAFTHLGPGSYTMYAKDGNNCEKWIQVDIHAPGADLAATAVSTPDSQCLTNNGTITLNATGGTAPYTYQLAGGTPGTDNVFPNLKTGSYTFTIRDSSGPPICLISVNVLVKHGDTGTSYLTGVKPILDMSCAFSGCHDGSNGSNRNWTVFANVASHAGDIKTRTGNKSMPPVGSAPALTAEQIQTIACWVDDGAKNN